MFIVIALSIGFAIGFITKGDSSSQTPEGQVTVSEEDYNLLFSDSEQEATGKSANELALEKSKLEDKLRSHYTKEAVEKLEAYQDPGRAGLKSLPELDTYLYKTNNEEECFISQYWIEVDRVELSSVSPGTVETPDGHLRIIVSPWSGDTAQYDGASQYECTEEAVEALEAVDPI